MPSLVSNQSPRPLGRLFGSLAPPVRVISFNAPHLAPATPTLQAFSCRGFGRCVPYIMQKNCSSSSLSGVIHANFMSLACRQRRPFAVLFSAITVTPSLPFASGFPNCSYLTRDENTLFLLMCSSTRSFAVSSSTDERTLSKQKATSFRQGFPGMIYIT